MAAPIVTLTPEIIDYADNVAALRRGQAFMKARKASNGITGGFDRLLDVDRMGARCEAAAKVYLAPIKWHAVEERIGALPDLGMFVDVKGRAEPWHELIVQKDAQPHFAYLLVTAKDHPSYEIVGWIWGHEAKVPEFWKDPAGGRPAYFVPQERLRPPEALRALIHPAATEAAE